MLDLETWGTAPGCALRSIGAVAFDPDGSAISSDTFYRNISEESCLAAGLIIDPNTEAWWAAQSSEANRALEQDQRELAAVVDEFHAWFSRCGIYVWSHGANFDEPIWCAVARAVGKAVPWRFWNVRDTRTAFDIGKIDPRNFARDGVKHNALDDARHQVICVQTAYRRLKARVERAESVRVSGGSAVEL